MANYAIILAAGDGKRLGYKTPKCFIKIRGKFIYQFSLDTFCSISSFKKIVLVVPKQYVKTLKNSDKRVIFVVGGKTRNNSFLKGIKVLKNLQKNDKILIHDAARINVQKKDILKLIKSKEKFGTLCYKGKPNLSDFRINNLNIQTPQFCTFGTYSSVKRPNPKGRDLISFMKLTPKQENFIFSSNTSQNFKITTAKDLKKA